MDFAASALLDRHVSFNSVAHIDTKESLDFCLGLRKGDEYDPASFHGYSSAQPTAAPVVSSFGAAASGAAGSGGRRAPPSVKAGGGSKAAAGASGGASGGGRMASGGASRGGRRGPETKPGADINVGPVKPKKVKQSRTGCPKDECIKVDKWSWHLEAENDKLREMLSQVLLERKGKEARQQLYSGERRRMEKVFGDLKESKEAQLVAESKLEDVQKQLRITSRRLKDMTAEKRSAQKQVEHLTAQVEELATKLKNRGMLLEAAQAEATKTTEKTEAADGGDGEPLVAPTSEVPASYRHNGEWGLIPGFVEHAVWSCCLGNDKSQGCTNPPPPVADARDELQIPHNTQIPLIVSASGAMHMDATGSALLREMGLPGGGLNGPGPEGGVPAWGSRAAANVGRRRPMSATGRLKSAQSAGTMTGGGGAGGGGRTRPASASMHRSGNAYGVVSPVISASKRAASGLPPRQGRPQSASSVRPRMAKGMASSRVGTGSPVGFASHGGDSSIRSGGFRR